MLTIKGIEVRHLTAVELVPSSNLKFVDSFGLLPLFERLCHEPKSKEWQPTNILLSGPAGCGKSLLFAYWAQENEIPYLALDCSEETRERHLKGGFIVSGGATPFVLGTVTNAIQVANDAGVAMLVLEELNALSPREQKILNPLLDFRCKFEVPEISHRFTVRPGARLFIGATMNPAAYGGAYLLNRDLKSRFLELDVPYPPPADEKRILREMAPDGLQLNEEMLDKLVVIAQQTRQEATAYALSTRDLVQLLHVVHRCSWEEALFFTAQKFNDEDRALVIDRIKDITRVSVHHTVADRAQVRNVPSFQVGH